MFKRINPALAPTAVVGANAIRVLSAQLLWCALYEMQSSEKKIYIYLYIYIYISISRSISIPTIYIYIGLTTRTNLPSACADWRGWRHPRPSIRSVAAAPSVLFCGASASITSAGASRTRSA